MIASSFLAREYLDRLKRWTPAALMIWIMILTLIPHNSELRILYLAAYYLLFPFLLGIHIVRHVVTHKTSFPIRWDWPNGSMVIYLFFVCLSFFWAAGPEGALQYFSSIFRKILIPFMAFWLVRHLPISEIHLKRWLPGMVVLCIVECIAGMAAWFQPDVLPRMWPGFVNEFGGVRITGTLSQADVYSASLLLFSTFIFHYGMHQNRRLLQFCSSLFFSIGVVSIYLSFSRASWLALIIVLMVMALVYAKMIRPYAFRGLLVGAALFVAVLRDKPDYAVKRLTTTQTIVSRIVILNAGVSMFMAKPLLGWGYGSYDLYSKQFVTGVGGYEPTDWEKKEAASHNTYLTMLSESGLVGFLLYWFPTVWAGALTMRSWLKLKRSLSEDPFSNWRFLLVLWSNLGFTLIISAFIDIHFFPFLITLFWLILGLIVQRVGPGSYQRGGLAKP